MNNCPVCNKHLRDSNAVYSHGRAKHKKHDFSRFRDRTSDNEESMAERMISAQLQRAMGEPIEEEYLLDALL